MALNFDRARTNMLDGQILTAGVIMPAVIDAFERIPREVFVPEALSSVAYHDEDLALGDGRYMMEPIIHAKMVEAVQPKHDDVVLDVGCATGYSSAIFSALVSAVIAVEPNQWMLDYAEKVWADLKVSNIAPSCVDFTVGHSENAPYDVIFLNGAVAAVPDALLDQLAPHGRLIAIVRSSMQDVGNVMLYRKNEHGQCSSHSIFQAGTPFLPGMEPEANFCF